MKSIKYTAISLLLMIAAFAQNIAACGYGKWDPDDYAIFRGFSSETDTRKSDERAENCRLWKQLTGWPVSRANIEYFVYKCPYEKMLLIDGAPADNAERRKLMQNGFARRLADPKNAEIKDFLLLAKECETVRLQTVSPWYYPVDGDDVSVKLENIAERALAYKGTKLADRYLLQAVRAMFTLGKYGECLNLWNERDGKLQEGLVKRMIRGYIAGALYRLGETRKAMEYYGLNNDLESVIYCARKKGLNPDLYGMYPIYEFMPDSPELMKKMNSILQHNIRYVSEVDYPEYGDEVERLKAFVDRVLKEKRCKNMAQWYYAAAYIYDIAGEGQKARRLLAAGEKLPRSQFLKESMRVLRIYLDARYAAMNGDFETKLQKELSWLDGKIRASMNPKLEKYVKDEYSMFQNYPFQYWNDALRQITFKCLVPRYLKAGKGVRAIQCVNMADFDIIKIANGEFGYRPKSAKLNPRRINYNTSLFEMLDTIPVKYIISYVRQKSSDTGALGKFLDRRGYTANNYFNDIIGTRMLRDCRYDDAVTYLSKVSPSFQYVLHTSLWMDEDPFVIEGKIGYNADYKLRFAREMARLSREQKTEKDPNRRALMMIRYSIGLRNSFNVRCWALTRYFDSCNFYYDCEYYENKEFKFIDSRNKMAAEFQKKALAMFSDRECKAQALLSLYWFQTLFKGYMDTEVAQSAKSRCDDSRDYKESRRREQEQRRVRTGWDS